MHAVSEEMYASAKASQQAPGGAEEAGGGKGGEGEAAGPKTGGGKDDVIDADYEIKDDKKRK
jgi:hypothetical protein